MVTSTGVEFIGLPAGGLRGKSPWTAVRNGAQILGSAATARRIVREFRPDVALVTGGYASVAVTIAAWTMHVPVLIYLPDIVPGLAIRLLSRFSALVAVTSEESRRYFDRRKVVVTGYPVRSDILTMDRTQASQWFALDTSLPALLVFGGSRGARSINQAVVAGLNRLLPTCQVIHVSGSLDAEWVDQATRGLPDDLRSRYHHYAYLPNMPAALLAADLAVARAGAATMGEFPAAGLPAILVPYPHSGRHQEPNAHYMARGGAAHVLADGELREKLVPAILDLMSDEHLLRRMRTASKALARPTAAAQIGRLARQLGQRSAPAGREVPK
jgi:UDP-N-acetylglucosamine--N-acetylmuramyl-(pentapeptide) pyrophosphoryl-undecaprenol N-acetylglucosamine transferase